jgi:hypothetical protein
MPDSKEAFLPDIQPERPADGLVPDNDRSQDDDREDNCPSDANDAVHVEDAAKNFGNALKNWLFGD